MALLMKGGLWLKEGSLESMKLKLSFPGGTLIIFGMHLSLCLSLSVFPLPGPPPFLLSL